jgi:thymidine phosphorylase
MLPQEIIRRKRDGGELSDAEVAAFVAGLTDGTVTDGQAAAFAMAVLWRGMSSAETVALTLAMRDSGAVLRWRSRRPGGGGRDGPVQDGPVLNGPGLDGPGLDGPVLDKHSTGGVGDKVSLILAPLLAACGAFVPMISGRGLGHTGGTLDKLEAIPGYVATPSPETFDRVVRETGFAIVGASAAIAPADKRLYAIRDVTATVDSRPLIVASILSKKLAAGADALVLDVKIGRGAFMTTRDEAAALAAMLVRVAADAGLRAVALLTDMNQVLGRAAGNALEVREAIEVLTGGAGDPRLREVTLLLAAEALVLGGLAVDVAAGRRLAEARLADGAAAECFARGIAALGGPTTLLQRPAAHLAAAGVVLPVFPERRGVVASVDPRALGVAIIGLGGGRAGPDDVIDPSVGLSDVAGMGEAVGERPLAMVHAASPAAAERAARAVRAAFGVADAGPSPELLHGRIAEAVAAPGGRPAVERGPGAAA